MLPGMFHLQFHAHNLYLYLLTFILIFMCLLDPPRLLCHKRNTSRTAVKILLFLCKMAEINFSRKLTKPDFLKNYSFWKREGAQIFPIFVFNQNSLLMMNLLKPYVCRNPGVKCLLVPRPPTFDIFQSELHVKVTREKCCLEILHKDTLRDIDVNVVLNHFKNFVSPNGTRPLF